MDTDFRRDLVSKISRLADRFSPDHVWYVRTMNSVFELGGSLVADETAHNLLRLIAEGPTGNDDEDELFRSVYSFLYLRLWNFLMDHFIQSFQFHHFNFIIQRYATSSPIVRFVSDVRLWTNTSN